MTKMLHIIPRKVAKERGLDKYQSTTTCKRGHYSERKTKSGYCCTCGTNNPVATSEKLFHNKIYGFGYNSSTKGNGYPAKDPITGKITKEYDHWRRMLCRSYDVKWKQAHPTYDSCSVSEKWQDYQDFAGWFHTNDYREGNTNLDKDLLVLGNKEYSPETCIFLPESLNKAIIIRGTVARLHVRDGIYESFCNGVYLGRSDYPLSFADDWIVAKTTHLQSLANKYKSQIDPRAYDALMNLRIEVADEIGSLQRVV